MNKESPKADAPVPPAGTEQALSEALNRASEPKPEESSGAALASDLISDAIDIVLGILD